MSQAYSQLVEQVRVVGVQWRTRRVLEGTLLALAVALFVLSLGAAGDQALHLGVFGRLLLFGLWLGALAIALWRLAAPPLLNRHSPDFFAALVEQQVPDFGNRLINALQLGRQTGLRAPRLIDAIIADALAATEQLDAARAAKSPTLRRSMACFAGAAVLAVLYSGLGGPAARTSFARVLLPTADIAPFTWTRLTVRPDKNLHLLEGSALSVQVQSSGRIPESAQLALISHDNHTRSIRMQQLADGEFALDFPSVDQPFRFSVHAGDARSRWIDVAVEPRPRVERMSITYSFPDYAGQEPRTIDNFDGHLHGLPQTKAKLTIVSDKDLDRLTLVFDPSGSGDGERLPLSRGADARTWQGELTLTQNRVYRVRLCDTHSNEVDYPATYTITLERDAPPTIAIVKPGRDMQARPEQKFELLIQAQDDLGLGKAELLGRINDASEPTVLQPWANNQKPPQRRLDLTVSKVISAMGLKPGDHLEYWATVQDRNNLAPQGPGKAETRHFHLMVVTPEQAQALMDQQLLDYSKVLEELIRLQRLNRAQTAEFKAAGALIDREAFIRRQTLRLCQRMEEDAFPAHSAIAQLQDLAGGDMASVVSLLESYRDAGIDSDAGKAAAEESLPIQDRIAQVLEDILQRFNHADEVRDALRKMKETQPQDHEKVIATLDKTAQDLDKFLMELKDLNQKYEKLPKRKVDELSGEDLEALNDVERRLDQWKQWLKDSVDAITKLPQGFVKDAALAENVSTIFEEIDKKPRLPTKEIATPVEEGIKALAQEVAEDLEMWMPDRGDNLKWLMEDPPEGTFEVPPMTLPDSLQDIVGDLIESEEEFDEEADDITGSWGGNLQAGWGIMDGPISTFDASGKTGNQLPNASEMTGRAGSGRRGRSSGQSVGDSTSAMEGRSTPARLTNEPYEEGNLNASKQLDPHGATGGGKKTGGGQRGLQGGTPPDFVKDMNRLAEQQKMLREKAEQIAGQLNYSGRPSSRVERAIELMRTSEQDFRDLRYDDAARKRKSALDELRSAHGQIDQSVNLTLQRASSLPPELRQQIGAGVQQAMPEGYEDLVGAYYKALSAAGSTDAAPAPAPVSSDNDKPAPEKPAQ